MSEDLRSVLAAEAERHRPESRPPVREIVARRQRRQRRRRAGAAMALSVAVAVMSAVAVAGPGGGGPRPDSLAGAAPLPASQYFDVRTSPDGRELVAIYFRPCEGPADLLVQEGSDDVRLSLTVLRPRDLGPQSVCTLSGVSATTTARLAEPLGERRLFVTGLVNGPDPSPTDKLLRLRPFDGARLLRPEDPQGRTVVREEGLRDVRPGAPTDVRETATWITTFFAPSPTGTCEPGALTSLRLVQGPLASGDEAPEGSSLVSEPDVAGAPAQLYAQGDGLVLRWVAAGLDAQLETFFSCQDAESITQEQFLAFARSLRPGA